MSLPGLALDHAFELRGGWTARARFTTVADGDLAVVRPGPDLDARRGRLSDRPWSWLVQVHGAEVVTVRHPGEHAGVEADAAVTAAPDTLLAVGTADCAPIALVAEGPAGPAVGAVHAGWRGLAAGVVWAAVDRLRALVDPGGGSTPGGFATVRAVLGPCIHASCYEFGAADLDAVVTRVGEEARGITSEGRPALDLPAAARANLARAGVEVVADDAPCTACDTRFHSHRARGDAGRQALLVWLDG
ncbi:MAG TPA: polyphenol oxidase family protein [Acidimicrobiales bacterium]|nr:polyphenol oxidase family protein [Acidimicrobiales bacterium]